MIASGHAAPLDYTPRTIFAYAGLARKRRHREQGLSAICVRAAQNGDRKAFQKLLDDLMGD